MNGTKPEAVSLSVVRSEAICSLSLQERMEWDLKRLDMIIHQLDNRKSTYTANDIIVAFQNRVDEQSFLILCRASSNN